MGNASTDEDTLDCPNGDMRKASCSDLFLNHDIQQAKAREATAWDKLESLRNRILLASEKYGTLESRQRGPAMREELRMREQLPELERNAQNATNALVISILNARHILTEKEQHTHGTR